MAFMILKHSIVQSSNSDFFFVILVLEAKGNFNLNSKSLVKLYQIMRKNIMYGPEFLRIDV